MVMRVGLIVTLFNLAFYVAFQFFPNSLYFDNTKALSDLTRYEKKQGWFSNFSWANLTDEQWKYALALGPRIYRNSVAASIVTFLVIQIFCPAPHKLLLGIVLALYFLFPTFYLVYKAGKYEI